MTRRFPILLALLAFSGTAFADSPLTSTDFHEAYASHPLVARAAEGHRLDDAMLGFLAAEETPPAYKLAIVNALGWSFDQPRDNSAVFLEHLCDQKGVDVAYFLAELPKFSSEELAIYGYMAALENYLEDDKLVSLVPILRAAVDKHRESYIANLALTLVECQLLMHDGDHWNRVWRRYQQLLGDEELKRPLSPEAIEIITKYLVIYADEN